MTLFRDKILLVSCLRFGYLDHVGNFSLSYFRLRVVWCSGAVIGSLGLFGGIQLFCRRFLYGEKKSLKTESLMLPWLPFSSIKLQERTILQHTKTQHSKLISSYVLE